MLFKCMSNEKTKIKVITVGVKNAVLKWKTYVRKTLFYERESSEYNFNSQKPEKGTRVAI